MSTSMALTSKIMLSSGNWINGESVVPSNPGRYKSRGFVSFPGEVSSHSVTAGLYPASKRGSVKRTVEEDDKADNDVWLLRAPGKEARMTFAGKRATRKKDESFRVIILPQQKASIGFTKQEEPIHAPSSTSSTPLVALIIVRYVSFGSL